MEAVLSRPVTAHLTKLDGCYNVFLVGKNRKGRRAYINFNMPDEATPAMDEYMEMLDSYSESEMPAIREELAHRARMLESLSA